MREGLALVLLLVAVLILNRDRFFADAPPDPAPDGDTVARHDPDMPADDLIDGSATNGHPATSDPTADDPTGSGLTGGGDGAAGADSQAHDNTAASGTDATSSTGPADSADPAQKPAVPVTSTDTDTSGTVQSVAVQKILENRCASCHGHRMVAEGFSVLRYDSLTSAESEYVVPGKLEDSMLWTRLAVDRDMPPKDQTQLTSDEQDTIRQWIMQGAAPFGNMPARDQVSLKSVWQAMEADLRALPPQQAATTRYFSFAELHNNSFGTRLGRHGSNVRGTEVAVAKAAASKLMNSLSWNSRLSVPVQLGPSGVLLRIQLDDYGWAAVQHWGSVQKAYPYGMNFESHPDAEMRSLYAEVTERSRSRLPLIRGDWMADALPRSPLYDRLLSLPPTVSELETRLEVDADINFLNDQVQRAGFSESGVSKHNRIVERHRSRWGSYWKSYDFGASEGRGNIFKFPLGPTFSGNPFNEYAFTHDGGEMIFNLPNGLQGYFLTDEKGNRISVGPITVVRDLKEMSGSPEIVNAISCMGCHRDGIIEFRDTVRESRTVPFGKTRLKVQQSYTEQTVMDKGVAADRKRFRTAGSGVEPVFHTVRAYQRDLEIDDLAAELFYADPEELRRVIQSSTRLRELGLGPVVQGAAIKRSTWSDLQNALYRSVLLELEIAEPLH